MAHARLHAAAGSCRAQLPRSPFRPGQKGRALTKVDALALEIALHEEAERAALQGALAALEIAWREAEEIAAIADALPVDLASRLRALRDR